MFRLVTQASAGEHLVARTSDARADQEMLAKTIIDDLNAISGKLWALTGVLTEKVTEPRAETMTLH